MRRPNGRCSLSGLVWPSPDPTFTDFRPSAHSAATASRRSSRHHTFSAPGTGFFAAETAARNRPCARPENERLKGRIGKARRQRAFSARLHMSAENVNAWWWMQPPSNRSLSLHFGEMQGDFRKMQGGGHRSPAEIHESSIAWNGVSLLKRAGKSRETTFPQQGSAAVHLSRVVELW